MTSALHAEGREFNPRPEYLIVFFWMVDVHECRYGQVARQLLRKQSSGGSIPPVGYFLLLLCLGGVVETVL